MKIEVLYIDGCPHFASTVDAVRGALAQYGLTCPVIETTVRDQRDGGEDGLSRVVHYPHQRFGYRAVSTPKNYVWDDEPHV
jgi:hypothetical protein